MRGEIAVDGAAVPAISPRATRSHARDRLCARGSPPARRHPRHVRSPRTPAWPTCEPSSRRGLIDRAGGARRRRALRASSLRIKSVVGRCRGRVAVGRQSAEGCAGAMAGDQSVGSDSRRADTGRGRRIEGGDP